jgi:hypothetical protein
MRERIWVAIADKHMFEVRSIRQNLLGTGLEVNMFILCAMETSTSVNENTRRISRLGLGAGAGRLEHCPQIAPEIEVRTGSCSSRGDLGLNRSDPTT